MAHIVEFTVEGLAGRSESLSFKLNRDFNVFCGFNGSGKTSLLKILHGAMSDNADPLWAVPFTRARVVVHSIDYAQDFTYTCEKPDTGVSGSERFEIREPPQHLVFATPVSANPSPRLTWQVEPGRPSDKPLNFSHCYLPTSRLYLGPIQPTSVGAFGYMSSAVSEEQLEELFGRAVNQAWSAYSARVLGTVQRAQAKGLADILVGILSGKSGIDRGIGQLDPAAAYERVGRFLERQGSKAALGDAQAFQENYLANPQLRNAVQDINKVEQQIQDEMAPREKLESLLSKMFTGNKTIQFSDSQINILGRNQKRISLALLSSGEKHLIRILIETVLAGQSSLILDEPEISMHVDWQRQLIQAMRQLNPDMQLVLATHSPEVIAEISDDKIFNL